MNRDEYLEWCKTRALECVDRNDLINAYSSMASDLQKHKETKDHAGISLGMGMLMMGELTTAEEMRKFINGFN